MSFAFGLPGATAMTGFFGNKNSTSTNYINSSTTAPASSYIGYIVSIFVVIIIILMFIHYFITPIFQLNPGGPGVIPVPGMKDSKLYWTKQPVQSLKDTDTILGQQSANWSFTLDFFIEEPLTISKSPRILFQRGGELNQNSTSPTLTGIAPNYNMCIALSPDTTDMIVSTLNVDNNMESVIVQNVPVQTPFRIGVVLMENVMEVYVNGMLYKTRKFAKSIKQTHGLFVPPTGDMQTLGKVMNLQIWKRVISPSEMRYAKPALASHKHFNPLPMKISASAGCSKSVGDEVSKATSLVSSSVTKLTQTE